MEVGHPLADRLDDTDTLVAQGAPGLDGGHIALEDVQIGAAEGGVGDAHHGIRGMLDARLGFVLPDPLARPVIDECFHGSLSPMGAGRRVDPRPARGKAARLRQALQRQCDALATADAQRDSH